MYSFFFFTLRDTICSTTAGAFKSNTPWDFPGGPGVQKEKAMATHSSVLAWRIPGTGEPGGLLSMGSHRVRHD